MNTRCHTICIDDAQETYSRGKAKYVLILINLMGEFNPIATERVPSHALTITFLRTISSYPSKFALSRTLSCQTRTAVIRWINAVSRGTIPFTI